MSGSPCAKPDSAQEEDVFMSYLNADCLSDDSSSSSIMSGLLNSPCTPESGSFYHQDFTNENNSSFVSYYPHYFSVAPFFDSPLVIPPELLLKTEQQPQPSIVDEEEPKRKRGRKKRESSTHLCSGPLTIAPAPALCENTNKADDDPSKTAALAKRQERLIKNRAAALLSRKRKREYLNQLEERNQQLAKENEILRAQVSNLETRLSAMARENQDLESRLMSGRATGVVLMIILFYFAIFSLPLHRFTIDKDPVHPMTGSARRNSGIPSWIKVVQPRKRSLSYPHEDLSRDTSSSWLLEIQQKVLAEQ